MRTFTHMSVSTATSLLIFNPSDPKTTVGYIALAGLGGAICDLDSLDTKKHKIINVIIYLSLIIGIIASIFLHFTLRKYLALLLLWINIFYGTNQEHRTYLHSIMGTVVLTLLINEFFPNYVFAFLIGMILHILFDIITIRKVRILYPLSNKGISLKWCCYNGKVNYILLIISLLLIGLSFII